MRHGTRRWMVHLTALAWLVCGVGALHAEAPALSGGADPQVVEAAPLTPAALEALVAPVALYPDDLLAIVLPAATFPLQLVQAGRYLDAVADDPSLRPDDDWDESVVALLNYPDVVKTLSGDLDWTWDLGQAVLGQQEDVLAAVERFRRQAHAAGNLASDTHQQVDVDGDVVAIRPADPEVIYVPYYEPTQVVVRHSYNVFHYYDRPCAVYYYPYPADHYLMSRLSYPFWGVTSVYSIGWPSRELEFFRIDQRSHPYFGYAYAYQRYHYFRPRLLDDGRYRDGRRADYPDHRWHPDRHYQGARPHDHERGDRGRGDHDGWNHDHGDRGQPVGEHWPGAPGHDRDPGGRPPVTAPTFHRGSHLQSTTDPRAAQERQHSRPVTPRQPSSRTRDPRAHFPAQRSVPAPRSVPEQRSVPAPASSAQRSIRRASEPGIGRTSTMTTARPPQSGYATPRLQQRRTPAPSRQTSAPAPRSAGPRLQQPVSSPAPSAGDAASAAAADPRQRSGARFSASRPRQQRR